MPSGISAFLSQHSIPPSQPNPTFSSHTFCLAAPLTTVNGTKPGLTFGGGSDAPDVGVPDPNDPDSTMTTSSRNAIIAGVTVACGVVIIVLIAVVVVFQRRATVDVPLHPIGDVPGDAGDPMRGIVEDGKLLQPSKISAQGDKQHLLPLDRQPADDAALFQNMLYAIVSGDNLALRACIVQASANADSNSPLPPVNALSPAALVPSSPHLDDVFSVSGGSPQPGIFGHLQVQPLPVMPSLCCRICTRFFLEFVIIQEILSI